MKSNKTRERILDASLSLFNEKKASNVSTVQISAAMKISPGNLYYYYANKEEVIRCIWNERISMGLKELMGKTKEVKSAVALLDYIETGLRHIAKYRFFYTELPTLFNNDNRLIALHVDSKKTVVEALSELYDDMNRDGKLISTGKASLMIIIENCIALSYQLISAYDIVSLQGKTFDEFLATAWLRMTSFLKPLMSEEMREEMDAELRNRGVDEEQYLQMYEGQCTGFGC